jgi:hypothetical protein
MYWYIGSQGLWLRLVVRATLVPTTRTGEEDGRAFVPAVRVSVLFCLAMRHGNARRAKLKCSEQHLVVFAARTRLFDLKEKRKHRERGDRKHQRTHSGLLLFASVRLGNDEIPALTESRRKCVGLRAGRYRKRLVNCPCPA